MPDNLSYTHNSGAHGVGLISSLHGVMWWCVYVVVLLLMRCGVVQGWFVGLLRQVGDQLRLPVFSIQVVSDVCSGICAVSRGQ
jgi:hypothetical protein